MAEDESYEEEIQIISEKLTTTTTIESVFNPVQRKGRTSRTSDGTDGEMMTYDSSSEVNKSNAIVTAADGSRAVHVTVAALDVEGNVRDISASPSTSIGVHAEDKVDANLPTESVAAVDAALPADELTDPYTKMNSTANANANTNANTNDNNDDDGDSGNTISNNDDKGNGNDNATVYCPMIRNLPELNLPEKILLVIDAVREENGTQFKCGTGASYSPLVMIKRAIETFLSAKSTIQRRHEFALMSLNSEDSQWLCDFTGNIKTLVSRLNAIGEDVSGDEHKTYDFGALFKKIGANLPIPETNGDPVGNVSFTTRVILIYARSNCIPKFHGRLEHLKKLSNNPYFFLDLLYVHETANEGNMCEEIYNEMARMEMNNFSYVMEVGRNAAKLHDCMAKLLAHPLQRPPQVDASYVLSSTAAVTQQMHATNV